MGPEQSASEQICQRFLDCDCGGIDESYEECVAAGVGELLELHEDAAALGLSFDPACLEARMARFAKLGCATDWSETGPYILCYLHVGERERGESCVWYPELDASDCRPGLGCHGGVWDCPEKVDTFLYAACTSASRA